MGGSSCSAHYEQSFGISKLKARNRKFAKEESEIAKEHCLFIKTSVIVEYKLPKPAVLSVDDVEC